jgi:hypothetical protein
MEAMIPLGVAEYTMTSAVTWGMGADGAGGNMELEEVPLPQLTKRMKTTVSREPAVRLTRKLKFFMAPTCRREAAARRRRVARKSFD